MHIQGDSGGICITLGNDSMSDSKQKSSLRTWVRFRTVTELWAFFNSRTRPHVNRAYGTSWRLVAYCMHSKH